MKAIVLGGGNDQISLITALKKRGYIVWMIDYNQNPIAKPFADYHIMKSTLNEAEVRDVIEHVRPDLIITCCTDQALFIAAEMAEEFGLFFPISAIQAKHLTNKKWMKGVLEQAHIPTAKSIIAKEFDASNFSDLSLPIVIKPVDSNSSKGVVKVNNKSELELCFSYSSQYSRSGEVICEEYLEGTEISIDAYVRNGKAIYLLSSILEKLGGNRTDFPICRSISPAPLSINAQRGIICILQKIVDAFELVNCPLIVQAMIKDDEIRVIELSARTGGGSKHHLINFMTGINVIELFIDDCEKKYSPIEPILIDRKLAMQYIYAEPCVFGHIEGLEKLKQEKKIIDYYIYKTKGMEIRNASNSGDRCCGFLADVDKVKRAIEGFDIFDINECKVGKIWN